MVQSNKSTAQKGRKIKPCLKRFDGPISIDTQGLVAKGSQLMGYEIAVVAGEPGFGQAKLPTGASVSFDVGPNDELVNSHLTLAQGDAVMIAWKEAQQQGAVA